MLDGPAREGAVSFHHSETEPALIADPLADLLLDIGAVVILIVIAIFPTVPRHSDNSSSAIRALAKHSVFRLEGRDIDPFLASERGLMVGGPSPRIIAVERIFFDEGLIAMLERMRDAGESVILLIEPKGFETAFQFEVLVSRHGPRRMRHIRLGSDCKFAKSDRPNCGDPVGARP